VTRALLSLGVFACVFAGTQASAAETQESGEYPLTISVRKVSETRGDPGFAAVRGMEAWPDGTVWIGDGRLSEVHEWLPADNSVRLALRDGQGPREVRRVNRMDIAPTGEMVISHSRIVDIYGSNQRPRRRFPVPAVWLWGFAALPNGGHIQSGGYGTLESDPLARWAVHRFDDRGKHVASWHAVADHEDWETVRSASGGPVALTQSGGLLVSDAAPFRITEDNDLDGNGARLVVEDEKILSSGELDRAVTHGPGTSTSFTSAWSKSFFVRELPDGNILNVIVVLLPEARENSSVWVIAGRDGEILARSEVEIPYEVWNDTSDGHLG